LCKVSFMSFHWHLNHHLLIRWCTSQLQHFIASASQKLSYRPLISYSYVLFLEVPPLRVPGTTWYTPTTFKNGRFYRTGNDEPVESRATLRGFVRVFVFFTGMMVPVHIRCIWGPTPAGWWRFQFWNRDFVGERLMNLIPINSNHCVKQWFINRQTKNHDSLRFINYKTSNMVGIWNSIVNISIWLAIVIVFPFKHIYIHI